MLSVSATNLLYAHNQKLRIFCQKSLVLYYNSTKCWYQKNVIKLALKRRSQKLKRKNIIIKKPSDDFEEIWLKKLSQDNLKLYRKTSFGSFRKVNINNLLEKLKVLYSLEECNNGVQKSSSCESISSVDSTFKNMFVENSQLASPYISEFLIKNMTDFPLLQSDCNNSLKLVLKEDKEDFGSVDSTKFPSVTRILSETMSESSRLRLQLWKNRMIKKLGEEEFYKQQADPELTLSFSNLPKIFIETPRKRKQIIVDLLNQGAKFHGLLRKYLENEDERLVTIDPDVKGCWKSLNKLLPDITNVLMLEEPLYHPVLMYKGVVDCVASYRGVPCVIEWKKSDKKKLDLTATYDAPLQLCAYLGALAWRKNPAHATLKNGLVVVAYNDGSSANVFSMDLECCQVYWAEWLRRLQAYWVGRSTLMEQEAEV